MNSGTMCMAALMLGYSLAKIIEWHDNWNTFSVTCFSASEPKVWLEFCNISCDAS